MKITFRCSEKEFKNIDTFLNEQEYTNKPSFDEIELITDTIIYNYKVINIGQYFYIVTD